MVRRLLHLRFTASPSNEIIVWFRGVGALRSNHHKYAHMKPSVTNQQIPASQTSRGHANYSFHI